MFENLDPRKGIRVSLLNEEGYLTEDAKNYEILSDDELLKAYKIMVGMRQADEWAVSLNRQGRMPTYPPNKGQEANSLGALMALRNDDWVVPAFRESAGLLYRGIPLRQIYLYYFGNELGSKLDLKTYHTLPVSIPIGSQTLHATGLAFAEKYFKHDSVVITFLGEGGSSEGEFYEAINIAGVFKLPVIFFVQNNQWAISVPRSKQTAVATIAEKAFACGFEGVQVDGNDIQAVYAITKKAAEHARKTNTPVLIEGFTYRLGAHTTADDPSRYRGETEVKEWEKKDPLIRIEKYLLLKNKILLETINTWKKEALDFAQKEYKIVEDTPDPEIEDAFKYLYFEMPETLKWQMERKKNLMMEL